MTAEDLVPGGRPELLLKMKWQHTDGDYGDNATEDTERTIIAVVGLDGAAPRWLGAFLNLAVDSTGPMLDDEPSEAPVTRTERAVDFRWLAASGELGSSRGPASSRRPRRGASPWAPYPPPAPRRSLTSTDAADRRERAQGSPEKSNW